MKTGNGNRIQFAIGSFDRVIQYPAIYTRRTIFSAEKQRVVTTSLASTTTTELKCTSSYSTSKTVSGWSALQMIYSLDHPCLHCFMMSDKRNSRSAKCTEFVQYIILHCVYGRSKIISNTEACPVLSMGRIVNWTVSYGLLTLIVCLWFVQLQLQLLQ